MGHLLIPHIFSRSEIIDLILEYQSVGSVGIIPAFHVDKDGTNQTGISTSTWTKVTWSKEVFDTNSDFASNKFLPTIAGKYLLTAVCKMFSADDTDQLLIGIFKNGTILHVTMHSGHNTANTGYPQITRIVEANGTTDYFETYVWHDKVGTLEIDGSPISTGFQGFKITE